MAATDEALSTPFAAGYSKEEIEKAEKIWWDVERYKPLEPARMPPVDLHGTSRNLVRERQVGDLDCGFYAVNTVLKNIGVGWSLEAQTQKLAAMQERVRLLDMANCGKTAETCMHKACRVPGLTYLVQRAELSQYDPSEAATFFAIDSLVPALELRLGEARVRMLAMTNSLLQIAVPLKELWKTLSRNNEDDWSVMDAYQRNTDWVIVGTGGHWKTYFRVTPLSFADLDSLHSGIIQHVSMEQLDSVRAVALIIPELPREDESFRMKRRANLDFAKAVAAEYKKLLSLVKGLKTGEDGPSPQIKKVLADRAVANVKRARQS